jgi:tRNA(Ile)-lysidine synthase
MIGKVRKTVEKCDLLSRQETVVAAVSGGPDSVALLAALCRLAGELDLKIIAAHFNHGLRGKESDADENFCRTLAGEMGVTFVSGRMKTAKAEKGISPEDFYRRKRYIFLERVARRHAAQKIALGHTLNDQAETVLINLLRGAGREGLRGILPMREGKYIRPLLEVSRREVEAFLKQNGLTFRRDSSNKNRRYLRNRIRLDLIPYLKRKYNPNIEKNLARMAEILQKEDDFIQAHVRRGLQSKHIRREKAKVVLSVDYLNLLPEAIRLRLLKKVLDDISGGKGISFSHVTSLEDLARRNESGRRVVLPFGLEAERRYGDLMVRREKSGDELKPFAYELKIPGAVFVPERNLTVRIRKVTKAQMDGSSGQRAYFDGDRLLGALVIRNRREGDWIEPLGSRGRKKIKKLFIDKKVPRDRRDQVLLLSDALSVIWIENVHLSERVKVTEETKNILELTVREARKADEGQENI